MESTLLLPLRYARIVSVALAVGAFFLGHWYIASADGPFKAEVFRISSLSAFGPENPSVAVHDGIVVWQDNRKGDWDIYGYDLENGREFPISTAAGDQITPAIYRPWVVWADNRSGNWDIYGFNLNTSQEFQITTDPSEQSMPSIWGNTVVWRDKRNWVDYWEGSYDLYGYDLGSGQEFPLVVTKIIDENEPQIWGRRVAYRAAGLHGIKFNVIGILTVYDLDRRTSIEMRPPEPMPPRGFALSGDRVAWVTNKNPSSPTPFPEMHITNLATGGDINLGEALLPTAPIIDGTFFVWSVLQGKEQDGIWLYDIESRTRIQIVKDKVVAAGLSNDIVVWVDPRPATKGLYGARIIRQLDWGIANGHFFTQTNGYGGAGGTGYSVTDSQGVPFWSTFQNMGGIADAGYPTSRRFFWKGFLTQAMQKLVFQWRPEVGQVYFVNVFDELSLAGYDPWLYAFRQTPPPFDTLPDTGLPWEQVMARHLAFLDADPSIKARYFAEPDWLNHFGLPMSYGDFGDVFVVRAQRAVLQRWKVDVPWAKAGEVVIANGGDIAKEVGLFPAEAVTPETPPGS